VKQNRPGTFCSGDPRINRIGRPKKGTALTDILDFKLDQKDNDKKFQREIIAEKLIDLAKNGNIVAIKYIFDRLDGMPTQAIELSKSNNNDLPDDLEKIQSQIEQIEAELGYKSENKTGQEDVRKD
jgi:hypothetical protein